MSEYVREYRRMLALHCLARLGKAVTAGDLVEEMGVSAQAEGHPRWCYSRMDARAVTGTLRSLQREHLVQQQDGQRRNSSYGRDEPLWEVVQNGQKHPMPMAPEQERETEAAAAARTPIEQLPQPQLLARVRALVDEVQELRAHIRDQNALLDVKDELLAMYSRHGKEVDEACSRIRTRLQRDGLLDA